jgi:hypothetical protein
MATQYRTPLRLRYDPKRGRWKKKKKKGKNRREDKNSTLKGITPTLAVLGPASMLARLSHQTRIASPRRVE